ncbi:MAG TPA: YdcF family protein [Vitreimonas sp.]|nr:YdcF family protein [Vitreimonas sp.]
MRRDLTRLILWAALAAVGVAAYGGWRVWEQGNRDERRQADAIVVLGAAQYDGRPSPVFRARLDHAVALHHEGVAPWLVVTGGKQEGDRTTEAAAARAFAVSHGVDPDAILVEDRGRTTLESLRTVGAMLRERGLTHVVFVSDRTHMLRVLRIARDQGLTPYGSPTGSSPTDAVAGRRLEATVHELGALAVYFLTGEQPSREDPAQDP